MADYLIQTEPGEFHTLVVKRTHETHFPLIFISTNSRTLGMSPAMASELLKALQAVLLGPFDRAISETALALEIDEKRFRESRVSAPSAPPAAAKSLPNPELDLL